MDTIRISTILSFITHLVNEGTIVQGYIMLNADEAKVHTAADSIRLTVLTSHNNYKYIRYGDTIYRDSGNSNGDWYPLCDI